jgi:hypothetical protein
MLQDEAMALFGLWIEEVQPPFPSPLTISEDVSVIGFPALQIHPIQDFGSGGRLDYLVAIWSPLYRPHWDLVTGHIMVTRSIGALNPLHY